MSSANLTITQSHGGEIPSPLITSDEGLAAAGQNFERLCQMALETRLVCQEQRRLLALQRERVLLLTRGVEEARLALAMQMSEMTELRAHLEETRFRLSKLRSTVIFID